MRFEQLISEFQDGNLKKDEFSAFFAKVLIPQPLTLDTSQFERWFTFAVNINAKEKPPEWDRADRVAPNLQTLEPKIEIAARQGVGHLNLKVPDANVKHCSLFNLSAHRPKSALLSSASTKLGRLLGSCGNAANAPGYTLLTQELILDGKHQTLVQLILNPESVFWACVDRLSLNKDFFLSLAELLAERVHSPHPEPIDRLSKQFFFHLPEEEDVLVTCGQHHGLAREFELRARARREADQWLYTRNTKVGGANPINAGRLISEMGARQRHLTSSHPEPNATSPKALVRALNYRQHLVSASQVTTRLTAPLIQAWERTQANIATREGLAEAADQLVAELLERVWNLREQLGLLGEEGAGILQTSPLSYLEKTLLDPSMRDHKPLKPDDLHQLADQYAGTVLTRLNILSQIMRDHLYNAFRSQLREF